MIQALVNTEKKPQVNGYASPSHLSSNTSNHAAKQSKLEYFFPKKKSLFHFSLFCFRAFIHAFTFCYPVVVEGYLRTDDRMRLAKERREERERSLGKKCQSFPSSCKLSGFVS